MTKLNVLPSWLVKQQKMSESSFHPAWLKDTKEKAWQTVLHNGFPTRDNERFKYADLSFLSKQNFSLSLPHEINKKKWQEKINSYRLKECDSILLVCINGYFIPEYSDLHKLNSSFIVLNWQKALQTHGDLIKSYLTDENQHHAFAYLNKAMFLEGLFLYVKEQTEITQPIHLLSLAEGSTTFIAHPHHLLLLGKGAKLNLIEEYVALSNTSYMMNISNHVVVGKEAQLDYCKIQNENKQAIHIAHTIVQQQENSETMFAQFAFGAHFARDELIFKLVETGTRCHTSGFYQLNENDQYIDHHIEIYHEASNSQSEMFYKGTVDKCARAVFNGRLYVEKDAQKIIAHQANHHLLFAQDAEAYAKPELEIYADDVKCKHGATIGQIDQEALFYLRSRGISHEEALSMIRRGFANEMLQRITHPSIRLRIEENM